jgi:ligand-binding sensor domain-containing protein
MFVFALIVLLLSTTESFALFNKTSGIESARVTCVAISKHNPDLIAASSRNSLYISRNNGIDFQKAASVTDERITHLTIDAEQNIYITGERRGYKTNGITETIFSARDDEIIHFIANHRGQIYVATSGGLYYAEETLRNWQSVPGLSNTAVYSIESAADDLYLTCDDGAYRLRPDGTLTRLFTTRSGNESSLRPQLLKVDAQNPEHLWLCTNKGLFFSPDRGLTWQKFYTSGASNVSINCFAQPPTPDGSFFLCTDAGLFKVSTSDGNAQPLYEGISASEVWWMDFGADGEIYLATSQGLFTDRSVTPAPETAASIPPLTDGEPSIQEIQMAALHYNSIHPDKIHTWRRQLKYRALLPKLSVDYDKSLATSSGKYYEGPTDWGLTLSWDMGDLIWNSYEDDIDNRNKLTTQLRIDILDEITRIYFERLRLKQEIALAEPNTAETQLKTLRLQELSATLDGYTGGYLSRYRTK